MTKPRPWWCKRRQAAALAAALLFHCLPAAAAGKAVQAKKGGRPPAQAVGGAEVLEVESTGLHGAASFYGPGFHGRRTATGEVFDQRGFTAASNRFPLGTWVAVRRLDGSSCVVVKINDRMAAGHRKRVIDLSRAAAESLGMIRAGVVLVRVGELRDGPRDPDACRTPAAPVDLPEGPDADWRPWLPPAPPQLDAMH